MSLNSRLAAISVLTAAACFSSVASASTVYTYVGNNYNNVFIPGSIYDLSMSIQGSLVLDSPLAPDLNNALIVPTSFSFSDGVNTFTEITSPHTTSGSTNASNFQFTTDSAGEITGWAIGLEIKFPSPTTVGDMRYTLNTRYLPASNLDDESANAITCLALDIATGSCSSQSSVNLIRTLGDHGSWSSATSVPAIPLPAAIWLFGTALIGLNGLGKRKKA